MQQFIRTEASAGIFLGVAALVALAWANSPWQSSYVSLWHTNVVVQLGAVHFAEDLRHVVNEGLMALFFLVVGLEVKREFIHGELAQPRVAALPVFAAVGGMVVPASLYLAVTAGSAAGNGWGIPMATDIAFALAVLGVLGSRVPSSLKLLLLTLAVVDDIGAIVVIAVFYSGRINIVPLAIAAGGLLAVVILRRLRVDWPPIYAAVGVAVWYGTYRSGVHATIAGVAIALTTPARPLAPTQLVRRWAEDLSDEPSAEHLRQMSVIARESVSPAEHLEARLQPFTSYAVLPVFALANAGVSIHRNMLGTRDAALAAAGVAVGLVVGKLVGIFLGGWVAVRLRIAQLPAGVEWLHLAGIAALGGIGFTVSLFVSGLAFADQRLSDAATLATLVASMLTAIVGVASLYYASRRR